MKRIIELTPEQKQVYEQMRKEALATLNGKTVTTMIALNTTYEASSNYLRSFLLRMMELFKQLRIID